MQANSTRPPSARLIYSRVLPAKTPLFFLKELKTMSSEGLHAPRERLSKKTLSMHQAIVSLMEELEAADWYRQRADDCEDDALREILLHNMREEIEHAAMVLEWLRRNDDDFDQQLRAFLFKEGDVMDHH